MRGWWMALLLVACEPSEETKQAAEKAAGEAADQAASAASTAADQAASAASTAMASAGARLNAELAALGDKAAARLDAELKRWLEGVSGDELLDRIREGSSSGKNLAKAATPLAKAVETDTTVLPIVRPVGDSTTDIDEAIGDMPRTEVIGGVTVGFRQLKMVDNHRHLSDQGYLVLWRRGDRLLGFVYRSKREVKIDTVLEETPRLMRAIAGT